MKEQAIPGEKGRKAFPLVLKRFILSLVSILAALAAAELALFVIGEPYFPEPHSEPIRFAFTDKVTPHGPLYVNQPGRITFRYDGNPRGYFDAMNEVHHDVNPLGFRGPAFKSKRPGTFRVVFLGDSFTFGEGVKNEDTYPEVTARQLRKDGRQAESCNLGVGGYNTSQEAYALRIFGFDLQPDVVVIGFTLNDAEPSLFHIDPVSSKPVRRSREAFIETEGVPGRPPDSSFYRFHLSRAIWKVCHQRRLSKQTVEYYLSLNEPSNEGRVESERAIKAIISECRQRGIPCVVVMFPLIYELSDDYPFTAIHRQVGEVVRKAGGRFIDMLPYLSGMDARKLVVHQTDQHPNEKVHAIAGKLVAEEIQRISDKQNPD